MQLLSADTTMFFFLQKIIFLLANENVKKTPSKVAHNHAKFFFQCIANQPKS
jgi:hypothetical protein